MTLSDVLFSPEGRMAVAYAPARLRPGFASLIALHARCESVVRRAAEPLPGQFRLAWHRGVLRNEAAAGVPDAELAAIIAAWESDPAVLVPIIDGWEAVLGDSPDLAAAARETAEPTIALSERAGLSQEDRQAVARASAQWTGIVMAMARRAKGDETQLPETVERIPLPRSMRPLAVLDGLARRALRQDRTAVMGDRLSPFAAIRLGILGR